MSTRRVQPQGRGLPRRLAEALDGLALAYRAEHNLRWQVFLATLAVTAGFLLGLDRTGWLWLLTSVFLVLGAETVNSAVEAAVDLASPQVQPLARYAKHVAAGAVLMAVAQSLAVAGLVLLPRLLPSLPEWPARLLGRPAVAAVVLAAVGVSLAGALGLLWPWAGPRNGKDERRKP